MRTFIPATMPMLAHWHSAGSIAAELGYAVTPMLREMYAVGDTEELEYVAMTHTARASLALLAAAPDAPRRRVVVAADAPGAVPDAAVGVSAVRLNGAVAFDAVASVHADDAAAGSAIAAAVAALNASDETTTTAGQYALEDAEAHELLWYATQEIPTLIA